MYAISHKSKETIINDIRTHDGKRLHPTTPPRTRALLVGAEVASFSSAWSAEDSLRELALLADTAGLEVVGSIYQRIDQPFPKYFIGPGKVREVAELREQCGAGLVIFDDELSPAQTRNLEEALQVGVLDRTALILDIFAQHARTHEGRLQVELAQYNYMLPRLRRQWSHLERQAGTGGGTSAGGVVGLRGPGETQLEIDRRLIDQRIAWLKEQLADVHRHRELYRQRRKGSGVPVVALVGYTNAGKSTLLNALSGADVLTQDQLFATLDPTTRQVTLPGNHHILLTDTVGFIQKLPTQLVAAFRATLEEINEADLLLHVVDLTHPNAQEHAQTVEKTLEELGVSRKATLTVLNKVDKLEGVAAGEVADLVREMGLPSDVIAVSAQRGWGLDQLGERIVTALSEGMVALKVLIPYQRNDLVSLWHRRGVIDREEYIGEGTHIQGRIPRTLAPQFSQYVD
ncbi:GTP-binding proten HflX [Oscillochloris trichoides DG-6]|uniref:GTPase HflX n=1 Tax=Oscillochloris trichoides DG-6 TaxID=765420 RepID=E1IHX3_9CHLR|nr:GTPase HflX [Oscillochloris trichoides]EFO79248.1 GTP-binding proten HflX [Oscillochloris trichoides DG-6]